jgi:hypothetical protein
MAWFTPFMTVLWVARRLRPAGPGLQPTHKPVMDDARIPALWTARYQELIEYTDRHGTLPYRSGPGSGPLANWCSMQRQTKRGTSQCRPLTRRQVKMLEAIPGWWWTPQGREQAEDRLWRRNYNLIEECFLANGRLPFRTEPGGEWSFDQRDRWAAGNLSALQTEMLDAIPGWWWTRHELLTVSYSARWKAAYDDLVAWVSENGRVPRRDVEGDDLHLAYFCVAQGEARDSIGDRTPLNPTQIGLLESIPGWIWPTRRKATE